MDCKSILERYNALRSTRDGCWINVWREVRRFCMPTYSDYLSEGGVRGQDIFDTTAIEARQRLAAGMYNWLAPPDQRWFELIAEDENLQQDEEVKDFFSEVTKEIMVAMANSNWSTTLIEALNNLACGLDAVVFCQDDADGRLKFRSFPIETVCYAENAWGQVDTVMHEFKMTTRQLLQEFEKSELPEGVVSAVSDPKRMDQQHAILHAVFPRQNRDPRLEDARSMPYADVYIHLESKKVILESGFAEMPFAVCRFERSDNESYGRGPGINMLPDIKMLNSMAQSYQFLAERQANPSWLAPDGSIVSQEFNQAPGALNFYKPDLNGDKPMPIPADGNLTQMYNDIVQQQTRVKIGFFWDIFDPLGDLKQMTATEAEIRDKGKLVPFSPIAGNLHAELFRVVIHRVFGILQRRNSLPTPPEILLEAPDYKVEFVSKIALSIQRREALNWLQTEASLANIAAIKPDIMDNFDLDGIARDIALANGSSPKWLLPSRDRDAVREQRAVAEQQQIAGQELLAGASALGQNMGRAPEPGSPLDAVMNGPGV